MDDCEEGGGVQWIFKKDKPNVKYKYVIVEVESDADFILKDNPENSFKAMRSFQSMSCDSVKTELFKIKDKADKETKALSFWWSPKSQGQRNCSWKQQRYNRIRWSW